MSDPLSLYVAFVAGVFVLLLGAIVYYESGFAYHRRAHRWGITGPTAAAAVVLGLLAFVCGGLLGEVPALDGRAAVRGFGTLALLFATPLILGLASLFGARRVAARWRRFRSEDAAAVCAGTVISSDTRESPVTATPASCWIWNVNVENPHGAVSGAARNQMAPVDGGRGGGPFAVRDDDGEEQRVDPTDASVDLGSERTVSLAAGESPPETVARLAPDVERQHGDKRRVYAEATLEPGDRVAVVGDPVPGEEGPDLTAEHVTAGSLGAVARRYRTRALGQTLAGLTGVAVGLWGVSVLFF